jgi:signal transduction histidine kinase
MFRPFFTTKKSGTGLGLALVQKIIVTHNGRVTAANADDGGARFIVTLPLGGEGPPNP